MKTISLIVTVISILYVMSKAVDASEPDWVRRYDCRRAVGPVVIDGVADEFAWSNAPETGEFTRYQKDGDYTVQYRTTAKMLWDDRYLYILVVVEDPDIWSTMKVRDVACLCEEETVEVFIDPDGDGLDYAELHINCLDTINDIWIPRVPGDNGFSNHDGLPVNWLDLYAWNIDGFRHALKNHGTVNNRNDTDRGSVFEMAIPWGGLGKIAGSAVTPPSPGDVWRMNVNRYERPRSGSDDLELSGWAPNDLQSYHVPDRFGYVTFISDY
ncbi:hypothetical protein ES708_09169 [subsurface metagenome]